MGKLLMVKQVIVVILAFAGYSFLHSVLATDYVKRLVAKKIKWLVPFYRLLYVISQTLLFFWMMARLPRPALVLWQVDGIVLVVFRFIQILGVVGFVLALQAFDLKEFVGLSQLKQLGQPSAKVEELTFNEHGLFRYMRHPIYFFSVVIFLFEPKMTLFKFLFLLWLIIYFWIGSVLEEKRMVSRFGAAYQAYQQRVNRFFPTIRKAQSRP